MIDSNSKWRAVIIRFVRGLYPSGLLLVVGLALTIAAFVFARSSIERQVREAFHLTVNFESNSINESLADHSAEIRELSVIVGDLISVGSDPISSIRRFDLGQNYPGLSSLQWVDTLGNTRPLYPDTRGPNKPLEQVLKQFGVQSVATDVMKKAADSEEPITIESTAPGEFLILCASRKQGTLTGYMLVHFDLDSVIQTLFKERAEYSFDPLEANSRYVEIITARIAGARKLLYFPMPKDFEGAAARGMPALILATGSVISILLFLVFRSVANARNRAEELAAKMTIDLRMARDVAISANHAKTEFLASMSHEIRNPINVIIGMGEILGGMDLADQQKAYLRTMQSAGEHLLGLINDILDLSRIESGQLELETIPFRLNDALSQVLDLYKFRAEEKGIELRYVPDKDMPDSVQGDPVRFRQIVVNLLSNAFKFTEKGAITLAVSVLKKDENQTRLKVDVTDSGIGIPGNKLDNIFEKFTQVDASTTRRFGGTGLGLAICKRLSEKMGGSISVSSIEGTGSTFSLEVPFAISEHATREIAAQKRTSQIEQIPLKILLADDSEDNQRIITLFLKDLPFELECVGNGKLAVDSCKSSRFDLILMDNQMPVMDGLTAVRQIREFEKANQFEPALILALTADSMKRDVENSIAAGCDGHITKPIRRVTLLEVIDQHVAARNRATGF